MPTIEALYEYPLAGGQPISLAEAAANPGAFHRDRMYTLYDTSRRAGSAYCRVGAKEFPALTQVSMQFGDEGSPIFTIDGVRQGKLVHESRGANYVVPSPVKISEFGDTVAADDMGDDAADAFSDFLKQPGLRLARRSLKWQYDSANPMYIPPAERRNAVVHIVSRSSFEALGKMGLDDTVGIDRFRANIVLADSEPFVEQRMIGQVAVTSGGARLHFVRPTVRGHVPGVDQQTGENLKDIPKLYRHLQQPVVSADGTTQLKPVFGVYGWLEPNRPDNDYAYIEVGDTINL